MIFGGYHIKQTFELAFCCAASFAYARPTFVSADPCTFQEPVPVGSVLYVTATVAYTDPPLLEEDCREPPPLQQKVKDGKDGKVTSHPLTCVHVRIDSKVRLMEHGQAVSMGQFNYTFTVPRNIKVLPHTYDEYMFYIDARRRVRQDDLRRSQYESEWPLQPPPEEEPGTVNLTE